MSTLKDLQSLYLVCREHVEGSDDSAFMDVVKHVDAIVAAFCDERKITRAEAIKLPLGETELSPRAEDLFGEFKEWLHEQHPDFIELE